VAFSPDGDRVVTASADKNARLWDAASGQEQTVLRGHGGPVRSAAFSPDGARVVTVSYDRTARFWDAVGGMEIWALRGDFSSASCSPDGTRVVTAAVDKTARVWDAASGKELRVLRGHEGVVVSAAFSPDGARVVTASPDKTARLWDAASGKEVGVLRGHESWVTCARFSPDGARVLTSSLDSTARVWDAASGKELEVLRGHENAVDSAAWSPDGTLVVTASNDNTARVWDPANGKELAVLRGHEEPVLAVVFSPDGARVVTASYDRTARVWDSLPYRRRYPGLLAVRRADHELRPLIEARLRNGEDLSSLRRQIAADPGLDQVRRHAALAIIRAHEAAAELEADSLNSKAWAVVRDPSSKVEAFAAALAEALRARDLDPESAEIVTTVGAAQYRLEQFKQSLATFTGSTDLSDARGQKKPAGLAVTAMAQFKLGRAEEARASLTRLKELMAEPVHRNDAESQGFLREAEALIEAPGGGK
jgi:hypothetical protein